MNKNFQRNYFRIHFVRSILELLVQSSLFPTVNTMEIDSDVYGIHRCREE